MVANMTKLKPNNLKNIADKYREQYTISLCKLLLIIIPFYNLRTTIVNQFIDYSLLYASIIIMIIILLTIAMIKRKIYLYTGHIIIIISMSMVWFSLFFGYNTHVVSRLDSIVLLIALMTFTPVLFNRNQIIITWVINFSFLFIFFFTNKDLSLLPGKIADDFFADTSVSFIILIVSSLLLYQYNSNVKTHSKKIVSDLQLQIDQYNDDIKQNLDALYERTIEMMFANISSQVFSKIVTNLNCSSIVQKKIAERLQIKNNAIFDSINSNEFHEKIILKSIEKILSITNSTQVFLYKINVKNNKILLKGSSSKTQKNIIFNINEFENKLMKTFHKIKKTSVYSENNICFMLKKFNIHNNEFIFVCIKSDKKKFEETDKHLVKIFTQNLNKQCISITNKEDSGKNSQKVNDTTNKKIITVIKFLEQNFNDNISRKILAQSINMHPDSFGKAFKKHTGLKINKYINMLRINFAVQQLHQTNKSIIRIAFDSGFDSIATFHRIFKQETGAKPSEYRKKY